MQTESEAEAKARAKLEAVAKLLTKEGYPCNVVTNRPIAKLEALRAILFRDEAKTA